MFVFLIALHDELTITSANKHNMGFQYAGLLLALIACVISPIPFLFFFKGEAVRKRSARATK